MAAEINVPIKLQIANLQQLVNDLTKQLSSLDVRSDGFKSLQKVISNIKREIDQLQISSSKPFVSEKQFTAAEKSVDKLEDELTNVQMVVSRIKFSDLKLSGSQLEELKAFENRINAIKESLRTVKNIGKQDFLASDAGKIWQEMDASAITKTFDQITRDIQRAVQKQQGILQEAQSSFNEYQRAMTASDRITTFLKSEDPLSVDNLGQIDYDKIFQNTKQGLRFKQGGKTILETWLQEQLSIDPATAQTLVEGSAKEVQSQLSAKLLKIQTEIQTTAAAKNPNAEKNYLDAQAKYSQLQAIMQQQQTSAQSVATAERDLRSEYQATAQQLQEYKDKVTAAASSNTSITSSCNAARQQLNSMSQTLSETNAKFLQMQRTAQSFNQMKMAVVNFMGFHQVLNLTKNALRGAINHIRELDTVMSKIAIVTDMSTGDLWQQVDAYSKMAQTYGVSIKGAYEVSQIYYQQGLATNDVLTLTNETLKLAKISGLDYATTTDYMTTALRGFKMEMSEASTVVDVYSNLAAHTAVSQEELAVAMSKTASSMESVGSTFEETSAMIGTMVAVTRESATNIGSAMKSIASRYGELTKDPTKLVDEEGEALAFNKVDAALQSVGISMRTVDGQFREFTDVIVELGERWDELDSTQQRYIATQFAGNRQQSRFLALVSNVDLLKSNLDVAMNSEDTGTLQALKALDSIEAKTEQVKVAYQQFYTTIGAESAWKGLLGNITNVINTLNGLPKVFGKIPVGAVALIADIVTIIRGVGETVLTQFASIWKNILQNTEAETAGESVGEGFISGIRSKLREGAQEVKLFGRTLKQQSLDDALKKAREKNAKKQPETKKPEERKESEKTSASTASVNQQVIDQQQATQAADAVKKEVEKKEATIPVSANTKPAEQATEEAKARINNGEPAKPPVTVDTTEAEVATEELKNKASAEPVQVQETADTTQAENAIQETKQEAENKPVQQKAEIDITAIKDRITEIRTHFRELKPNINTAEGIAQLEKLKEQAKEVEAELSKVDGVIEGDPKGTQRTRVKNLIRDIDKEDPTKGAQEQLDALQTRMKEISSLPVALQVDDHSVTALKTEVDALVTKLQGMNVHVEGQEANAAVAALLEQATALQTSLGSMPTPEMNVESIKQKLAEVEELENRIKNNELTPRQNDEAYERIKAHLREIQELMQQTYGQEGPTDAEGKALFNRYKEAELGANDLAKGNEKVTKSYKSLSSAAAGLNMLATFFNNGSRGAEIFSGSLMTVSGALRGIDAVMTAISTGNPFGAILAGAMAVISIINGISTIIEDDAERLARLEKTAEEASNKAKEAKAEYRTLDNSIKKLDELAEKRHESAEAAEEYQTAVDDLAEKFPEMIAGFDEAGNVILDTTDAEAVLAKAREKSKQATYDAAKEELKRADEQRKQAKTNLQGNINTIIQQGTESLSQSLPSQVTPFINFLQSTKFNNATDLLTLAEQSSIIPLVQTKNADLDERGFMNVIAALAPKSGYSPLRNNAFSFITAYQNTYDSSQRDITTLLQFLEQRRNEGIAPSSEEASLYDFLKKYNPDEARQPAELYQSIMDQARELDKSDLTGKDLQQQLQALEATINEYQELTGDTGGIVGQIQNQLNDYNAGLKDYISLNEVYKGNERAVISAWQQSADADRAAWQTLESSSVAAAMVTKQIQDSITDDDFETASKDSAETWKTYQQNMAAFLKSLNPDELEKFNRMTADTANYSADDIIKEFSPDENIADTITKYYLEGVDSIRTRLNAGLARSLGRDKNEQGDYDKIESTEKGLDEFQQQYAETIDLATTTTNEKYLNSVLKQYENLKSRGFTGLAQQFGTNALKLYSEIEQAPAEIQKQLWAVINEEGVITLEALDTIKKNITEQNKNLTGDEQINLKFLDSMRESIIPNINLSIQTATSDLLETWEDTSKELGQAMSSGLSLKDVDAFITKVQGMGLNISLNDFTQVGDKLVLTSDMFNQYFATLQAEANTQAEELQKYITNAQTLVKTQRQYWYQRSALTGEDRQTIEALIPNFDFDKYTTSGKLNDEGIIALSKAIQQSQENLDEYNEYSRLAAISIAKEWNWKQGNYFDYSVEDVDGQPQQIYKSIVNNVDGIIKLINDDINQHFGKNTDQRAMLDNIYQSYDKLMSDVFSKGFENIHLEDYEGLVVDDTELAGYIDARDYTGFIERYASWAGKTIDEMNDLFLQALEKENETKSVDIIKDLQFVDKNTVELTRAQLKDLANTFDVSFASLLASLNPEFDAITGKALVKITDLVANEIDLTSVDGYNDVIEESIRNLFKNISGSINNAIKGNASTEQLAGIRDLANRLNIPDLSFTETAEGWKMASNSAYDMYDALVKVDALQAKSILPAIKETNSDYSTLAGTLREIANLNKQIAENQPHSATQMTALQGILQEHLLNPDSMNFMSTKLPDDMQAAVNAWENTAQGIETLTQAEKDGYMGVQDFYNIVSTASSLMEAAGEKFSIAGKDAATLMQQAAKNLVVVDGKLTVDLSDSGMDIIGSVGDLKQNLKTGVDKLARAQIAMLDAEIKVLEVAAAMEKMGDVDVDLDGIAFEIDDIFEGDVFSGDFTEYLKDLANLKELREIFEQIKINGKSLYDLISSPDWATWESAGFTKESMAQFFQSLANTDWDLENIQAQAAEILGSLKIPLTVETDNGFITFSITGEMFEVDLSDKDRNKQIEDALRAAGLMDDQPLQDAVYQAWETYNNKSQWNELTWDKQVDVLIALGIAQNKINVSRNKNGTWTGTYNGNTFTGKTEDEVKTKIAQAMQMESEGFTFKQNEEGQVEGTLRIGKATIKVVIDENGERSYTVGDEKFDTKDEAILYCVKNGFADSSMDGYIMEGGQLEVRFNSDLGVAYVINHATGQLEYNGKTFNTLDELREYIEVIEPLLSHGAWTTTTTSENFEITTKGSANITRNLETGEVWYTADGITFASAKDFAAYLLAKERAEHDEEGEITFLDDGSTQIQYKSEGNIVTLTVSADGQMEYSLTVGDTVYSASTEDGLKQALADHKWLTGGSTKPSEEGEGPSYTIKQPSGTVTVTYGIDGVTVTPEEGGDADAAQELEDKLNEQWRAKVENVTPSASISNMEVTTDANTTITLAAGEGEETTATLALTNAIDKVTGIVNLLEIVPQEISTGELDEDGIMIPVKADIKDAKKQFDIAKRESEQISKLKPLIKVVADIIDAINKLSQVKTEALRIAELKPEFTVTANIQDAIDAINRLKEAIQGLKGVTVTITTTGSSGAHGGKPTGGNSTPPAEAVVNAKGTARSQGTLVGELGPELIVQQGRYFVAGQNGAEFVDLAPDAIVFNHLQTEQLLKKGMSPTRGRAVTNERVAASYAHGSLAGGPALASASAALAELKKLKSMWQSLLSASVQDLANLGGSGGGGGGGGNNAAFINQLERWYNYLQEIATLEEKINREELRRSKIQSDMIPRGQDLVRSQLESLDALKQEVDTRTNLWQEQKKYLDQRIEESKNSPFASLYTMDESGQLKYKPGALQELSAMSGTDEFGKPNKSVQDQYKYITETLGIDAAYLQYDSSGNKIEFDDKGNPKDDAAYQAAVQAFWDRIEADRAENQSLVDSINESKDAILEAQSQQNEIMRAIEDNQISVENQVLDAIVDAREREIEELQKQRDAIEEASGALIDGLSEQLNKEREMYNNQQKSNELTGLQRRLSILQRSGGSASEIASLQQQITDKQQDAYFDAQQAQIDALQEASDAQLEKLDAQIDLMNEQLAYEKDNGLLWGQVAEIMKGSPEEIASFIAANNSEYWSQSPMQKEQSYREALFEAQQFVEFRERVEGGMTALINQYADTSTNDDKKPDANEATNTEGGNETSYNPDTSTPSVSEDGTDQQAEAAWIRKPKGAKGHYNPKSKKKPKTIYKHKFDENGVCVYCGYKKKDTKPGDSKPKGEVTIDRDTAADSVKQSLSEQLSARIGSDAIARGAVVDTFWDSVERNQAEMEGLYGSVRAKAFDGDLGEINNSTIFEKTEVILQFDKMSSDYDAKRAGQVVMDEMMRIAQKQSGSNRINRR